MVSQSWDFSGLWPFRKLPLNNRPSSSLSPLRLFYYQTFTHLTLINWIAPLIARFTGIIQFALREETSCLYQFYLERSPGLAR